MDSEIAPKKCSRRAAIRLAICAFAAPAIALSGFRIGSIAAFAGPSLPPESAPEDKASSDFAPSSILEPSQLTALLSHAGEKPTVICVGFKFLYDTAHIPGALFLGPAREAAGLAALEKWARGVTRSQMVALYCGCCPWEKCPNIRPAYAALRKMSFSQLRVVRIDQDFATDWVDKGLPTTKK